MASTYPSRNKHPKAVLVRGPTISKAACAWVWLTKSAARSMKAMLFMRDMENIIETPQLAQINIEIELSKI